MNHSKKASSQFFKAHGNSTIIFDFHKKALYQMTKYTDASPLNNTLYPQGPYFL